MEITITRTKIWLQPGEVSRKKSPSTESSAIEVNSHTILVTPMGSLQLHRAGELSRQKMQPIQVTQVVHLGQ